MSKIQFGPGLPSILEYDKENWSLLEKHYVEFFPNKWYHVILISTETPNFMNYLNENVEDKNDPIALDLEWEDEICLFQFCFKNTKNVIIIRHPDGPGNADLLSFLKTHYFYAKGTHSDLKQLKRKFNITNVYNIVNNEVVNDEIPEDQFDECILVEDIERTRLIPYDNSVKFMDMVKKFAGEPTAEFKNVQISISNWSYTDLTKRQILYAAFDVVALVECYANYPPPLKHLTRKEKRKKKKKEIDQLRPYNPNHKKRERQRGKSSKIIVKFKRIKLKELVGFIIKNYTGSLNYFTIKHTYFSKYYTNIDFVSIFESTLFIGFYKNPNLNIEEIVKILQKYGTVTEIQENSCFVNNSEFKINDCINTLNADEGDVIFFRNVSEKLIGKLNELLYCFGTNHDYTIYNRKTSSEYIRIEPRNSAASYRIRLFLNHFEYDGKQIKISPFPYFIPKIRITNIPSNYNENDIRSIFNSYGKITSIDIMRRQFDYQNKTAIIAFSSVKEANAAILSKNHAILDEEKNLMSINPVNNRFGFDLNITKFTDEQHLRFIRKFEITDRSVSNASELKQKYKKYGPIFQYFYDNLFKVGRIQFYHKKDALNAFEKENNDGSCTLNDESHTIVIRDLAFNTTDDFVIQLCSEYGTIKNIVDREINDLMRFVIKEVTFSSNQEANLAKISIGTKTINGISVRIAILNGGNVDVADWKMRQRKQWLKFPNIRPHDELISQLSQNISKIIKILYFSESDNEDDSYLVYNINNNKENFSFSNSYFFSEATFVMFQTLENIPVLNPTISINNYSNPSVKEFVELLNFDQLDSYVEDQVTEIKQPTDTNNNSENSKINQKETNPVSIAIILDPLPDDVDEDYIHSMLREFRSYYELSIDNSNFYPGKKRIVILPSSHSMTSKLYTILNANPSHDSSQQLKPYRMRFEDIPNPPSINLPNQQKTSKPESPKMVIVIDPFPKNINESEIQELLKNCGNFNISITKSSKELGSFRLILRTTSARTKKQMYKILKMKYKGIDLNPQKMYPYEIPQPLEE